MTRFPKGCPRSKRQILDRSSIGRTENSRRTWGITGKAGDGDSGVRFKRGPVPISKRTRASERGQHPPITLEHIANGEQIVYIAVTLKDRGGGVVPSLSVLRIAVIRSGIDGTSTIEF